MYVCVQVMVGGECTCVQVMVAGACLCVYR